MAIDSISVYVPGICSPPLFPHNMPCDVPLRRDSFNTSLRHTLPHTLAYGETHEVRQSYQTMRPEQVNAPHRLFTASWRSLHNITVWYIVESGEHMAPCNRRTMDRSLIVLKLCDNWLWENRRHVLINSVRVHLHVRYVCRRFTMLNACWRRCCRSILYRYRSDISVISISQEKMHLSMPLKESCQQIRWWHPLLPDNPRSTNTQRSQLCQVEATTPDRACMGAHACTQVYVSMHAGVHAHAHRVMSQCSMTPRLSVCLHAARLPIFIRLCTSTSMSAACVPLLHS